MRSIRKLFSYTLSMSVLPPIVLFLLLPRIAYAVRVTSSTNKHNFSVSGPGPVKSTTESQVCVFCHTPHSRSAVKRAPLWNHTLSNASYQGYTSRTLLSPSVQPDESSKLCLSCHDGTVAVASLVNTGGSHSNLSVAGIGAAGTMPNRPSNLGTDLSGHHPVSIEINQSLIHDKKAQCDKSVVSWKICFPSQFAKLRKTKNAYGSSSSGSGLQCTSCHDPHEDPSPGMTLFLRVGDKKNFDQLCTDCHKSCSDICPEEQQK